MASWKLQSQRGEGEAQQGSPTLNETRPLALKFGCPLESSGAFGNARAQVTPQRSDFIGLGRILGTEIFKPFPRVGWGVQVQQVYGTHSSRRLLTHNPCY